MGQGGLVILGQKMALAAVLAWPALAAAQEAALPAPGAVDGGILAPILSLNPEALFVRSKFGEALRAEIAAATATVEAESRRIDAELAAEELRLTEQRAEMTPQAFAPLASAFDEKVQRLRAERDQAAEDLRAREVAGRQRFFDVATKVIGDVMVARGAVAIIDKGSIIVSLSAIDVTDEVVAELDRVLGDGSAAPP